MTQKKKETKVAELPKARELVISEPKLEVAQFTLRGNAPYVQNKFAQYAKKEMKAKQEAGSTAKKNTKRKPKNFQKI